MCVLDKFDCQYEWLNKEGREIKCRNCGKERRTKMTDLSCVREPCPALTGKTIPLVIPISEQQNLSESQRLPNANYDKEGNLIAPPLFTRMKNFNRDFIEGKIGLTPSCTQEEIDERLKICIACPYFIRKSEDAGICGRMECGCNINAGMVTLNKLAHSESSCPIGKWGPIVDNTVTNSGVLPSEPRGD